MRRRTDRLSCIAHAIADPTRRSILSAVARRERRITELAGMNANLTLAAVSKHLNVLVEARLVKKRREGREVYCSARLQPLAQLERYLANYTRFWNLRVDELERHLRHAGADRSDPAGPTS